MAEEQKYTNTPIQDLFRIAREASPPPENPISPAGDGWRRIEHLNSMRFNTAQEHGEVYDPLEYTE